MPIDAQPTPSDSVGGEVVRAVAINGRSGALSNIDRAGGDENKWLLYLPGAARKANHSFHTSVDFHTCVEWLISMNAQELKRLLVDKGCKFETHRGGSGHLTVRRGDRKSQLPMHGAHKELGKGLVHKILKDLGLK